MAVLQATTLPYASANRAAYQGSLSYSTNATGVICRDKTTGNPATNPAACDNLPNPPSVGTIAVAATFQPTYKIAVIDKQALLSRAPTLTNISAACSESATFAVAGGGTEAWRVSCTPADIASEYLAIGTKSNVMLMNDENDDRNAFPGAPNYNREIPINPHLWEGICRRISTGEDVAMTNCNPPETKLYVPGTINPQTRFIYIAWEDMLNVMPEHRDKAGFCSSSGTIQSNNGRGTVTNAPYKVSCDPHSVDMHYENVPTRAYPIATTTGNPTYSSDQGYDYTAPLKIDTTRLPICTDTDTGLAVDSAICANIPQGRVGNFSITATYSPAYRKVLINWDDILALVPNALLKTTVCDMDVNISGVSNAGSTVFRTTCNPEGIRRHHKKVPTSAYHPGSFLTQFSSTTSLGSSAPNFTMTASINVSVSKVECVDTDNGTSVGQANTTNSPCFYLAENEESKLRSYSFRVSPSSKTITLRWSDVLANSPGVTNRAEYCGKTGITLYTSGYSSFVDGFKMACD